MRVDLVSGALPYKFRVRPLNPDQKENLQTQIDEWLEQGVIELQGVATSTSEEEGRTDKVGQRSKRAE